MGFIEDAKKWVDEKLERGKPAPMPGIYQQPVSLNPKGEQLRKMPERDSKGHFLQNECTKSGCKFDGGTACIRCGKTPRNRSTATPWKVWLEGETLAERVERMLKNKKDSTYIISHVLMYVPSNSNRTQRELELKIRSTIRAVRSELNQSITHD